MTHGQTDRQTQTDFIKCPIAICYSYGADKNSKGVYSIWGLKVRWGGLRLRDAISGKRCDIELRGQFITNKKSYMGFRLQQKSMTLTDIERQFTALLSVLCVLRPNACSWNHAVFTIRYQYTTAICLLNNLFIT